MRSFISIELEPEVKNQLFELQMKSKNFSRKGIYTPKENMHINLYFLGEIERDDVEYISVAMYEIGKRINSFDLGIKGIGFFPKGKIGVMYADVIKSKELEKLFFGLSKSLNRQGFGKDKTGLTPHITLGRNIEPQRNFVDLGKKMTEEAKSQPIKINVKGMSLIESKRRGNDLFNKVLYFQDFK